MGVRLNTKISSGNRNNNHGLRALLYFSVIGCVTWIISNHTQVFGDFAHSLEEAVDQPTIWARTNQTKKEDNPPGLSTPSPSTFTIQNQTSVVKKAIATTSSVTLPKYIAPEAIGKADFEAFNATELHPALEEFYRPYFTPTDGLPDLWDDPKSKLPEWMKAYLRWHKQASQDIDDEAHAIAQNKRFLLAVYVDRDAHCGGVSDRLKPIPLLLRTAYYSQRILLIHWNRPGQIQEFLSPPKGGMNWTAPHWIADKANNYGLERICYSVRDLWGWPKTTFSIIGTRVQDYHGGMYGYDDQLVEGEPSFQKIFHEVWRLAFTPSPPVRAVIESEMKRLELVPGKYVSAHLRVLYGMEDRREDIKKSWTENALNCASELRPNRTIFLASDSMNATYYAKVYAQQQHGTVRTRIPNPNPPLHMDKVKHWKTRKISDFYDTFVDIYVMSQAGCMTYNKGGYGVMALMISRNVACGVRQDALDRPSIRNPCRWVSDVSKGTENTRSILERENVWDLSSDPIYVPEPMTVFYGRAYST